MTIITTSKPQHYDRIVNDNKHLINEGEIISIKGNYCKRVYYKVDNQMQLRPKQ